MAPTVSRASVFTVHRRSYLGFSMTAVHVPYTLERDEDGVWVRMPGSDRAEERTATARPKKKPLLTCARLFSWSLTKTARRRISARWT